MSLLPGRSCAPKALGPRVLLERSSLSGGSLPTSVHQKGRLSFASSLALPDQRSISWKHTAVWLFEGLECVYHSGEARRAQALSVTLIERPPVVNSCVFGKFFLQALYHGCLRTSDLRKRVRRFPVAQKAPKHERSHEERRAKGEDRGHEK